MDDSTASLILALSSSILAVSTGILAALITWRHNARKSEINMSIRRGSVRVEIAASGSSKEVQRVLDEIMTTLSQDEEARFEPGYPSDPELALVRVLKEIETTAHQVLDPSQRPHPGWIPSHGLFQLRKALREAGFWTDDDLAKFDNVVRSRNTVVHGDHKMASDIDLRSTLRDAQSLLDSLRAQVSRRKGK